VTRDPIEIPCSNLFHEETRPMTTTRMNNLTIHENLVVVHING
jgi:hypothetical protein